MPSADQTMMKVQRILTGPMGLKVMLDGEHRFRITFTDSSTHLLIRIVEWGAADDGEARTLVLVSAPLLRAVPASAELFEWVARVGGSRWFGHVEALDDEEPGTVHLVFSHTLLGDVLDQPELEAAMWSVLATADEWDDELQGRFGGKRWTDE